MKIFSLLTVFTVLSSSAIFAQSESDWLFDDSSLPEIYITVDPSDLNQILTNVFSDTEYPADFVFIRENVADTVKNIGFRIRGNTSRVSLKKSFKISFDTFEDGREYRGLDKMNMNGEHNDPSIIRSKLSWEVFEALDVPAPRSNHVKFFINKAYYGLYINVEHIDNEFVEDRFGSDAGNLYKALYPADLTYLGENPDDYKKVADGRRLYDLKTNEDEDDYSDIANLIKFLENSSDSEFENEIRDYINVDGVIRVMAVDIITGMWDDYMFNKNNFYLYFNPNTTRFEFIPYDYDNSFGIDWFGIDWDVRDINNWGTNESRPLTDRVFSIQKYRDHLNYYINKLLDEHFNNVVMIPEIDRLKAMIQEAAEEDVYRTLDYGYTIDDFNRSYDFPLEGHVKNGIKGYLSNRHNTARTQVILNNISPIIKSANVRLSYLDSGAALTITADVFDDDTDLTVSASIQGIDNSVITLNDAGLNGDLIAGDGLFTTVFELDEVTGSLNVEVAAEDQNNQTDRFPYNQNNFMEIEFADTADNLVINEFMASNNSIIQDETEAFEDWVEIYNPTNSSISLSGYFLTDDLTNPTKWAFPDTTILADDFLLVWTDDDEEDGPVHTSFKLSRSGEDLGLFFDNAGDIETVDAFTYGEQTTDISYGRIYDGSVEFVSFTDPTPGISNGMSTFIEGEKSSGPNQIQLFQNYPNPFNPSTTISFSLNQSTQLTLNIYSINGSLVQTVANGSFNSGSYQVSFDAGTLASGIYFYRLETEMGEVLTRKMTLLK